MLTVDSWITGNAAISLTDAAPSVSVRHIIHACMHRTHHRVIRAKRIYNTSPKDTRRTHRSYDTARLFPFSQDRPPLTPHPTKKRHNVPRGLGSVDFKIWTKGNLYLRTKMVDGRQTGERRLSTSLHSPSAKWPFCVYWPSPNPCPSLW